MVKSNDIKLHLLPMPQKILYKTGFFRIKSNDCILLQCRSNFDKIEKIAVRLQEIIKTNLNVEQAIAYDHTCAGKAAFIFCEKADLPSQSYNILIEPDGIRIEYGDPSSAFYAVATLKQIILQMGTDIPCALVEDYPDFAHRGVLLDVSRCKIPKMETFYKIIDILADIKINQLQLYFEGFPFAYPSYPEVWKDGTPLTGEEIQALDLYCKDRFIDFVPCQNSFGHMQDWLTKEQFNHLAESPDGFLAPWGKFSEPGTLDPNNPGSLELAKTLFNDILPYYSSEYVNVCCDETYELGLGKSRELCERIGKGRVYLDYVLKLYNFIKSKNKKMMFWGDIIIQHPELIPEIPKDVVLLEWGYEAGHDFENHCLKYKNAGIPFYVCPGTSSWNTIAGRTTNMKENLINAAINGKKTGATGYMITDWGDNGHWQHLPVSYAGICYGGALSWAVNQNADADTAAYLDSFIFKDKNHVISNLLLMLGDYYKYENKYRFNGTYTARCLLAEPDDIKVIEGLSVQNFEDIIHYVKNLSTRLEHADIRCEDAELIINEVRNTVRMLIHAAKLGILKLKLNDKNQIIDKDYLQSMADDMDSMIDDFKMIWLRRNRPGNLDKSIEPLRKLSKFYKEMHI